MLYLGTGQSMEANVKQDNRGLSLVEVIIVVAIMSVLIGITGFGLGMINGKPADECAQKITYSLQNSRTKAMGKYALTYELYMEGDVLKVKETVQNDPSDAAVDSISTVGAKGVTATYKLSGDTTEYSISGTNKLVIRFDRAGGGFAPVDPTTGKYCEEIKISKASTTRTITLVPPTGKVTLD